MLDIVRMHTSYLGFAPDKLPMKLIKRYMQAQKKRMKSIILFNYFISHSLPSS